MEHELQPIATHNLPFFITPPGSPDLMFMGVVVFLIGVVVVVGVSICTCIRCRSEWRITTARCKWRSSPSFA